VFHLGAVVVGLGDRFTPVRAPLHDDTEPDSKTNRFLYLLGRGNPDAA
jgi:hypothetical protein